MARVQLGINRVHYARKAMLWIHIRSRVHEIRGRPNSGAEQSPGMCQTSGFIPGAPRKQNKKSP